MKNKISVFLNLIKEWIFILPACTLCILAVAGIKMNRPDLLPFIAPAVSADEIDENQNNDTVKKDILSNRNEKSNEEKETVNREEKKDEDLRVEDKIINLGSSKSASLKDGVYEGTGDGFGGKIKVRLTVLQGKITDIEITKHDGETPSFFENALLIVDSIIKNQTPLVDNISGATFSSMGIKEAVADALGKAYVQKPIKPLVVREKSDEKNNERNNGNVTLDTMKNTAKQREDKDRQMEKLKENLNGNVPDGVYEGSALCEVFDYTVNIKVKFRNGRVTAIYGLKVTGNTDKANEEYWIKAYKPMVKRLLSSGLDADTVSGATYSSNAFIDAYEDACIKAYEAAGNTMPDKEKKGIKKNNADGDGSTDSDKKDTSGPDILEDDTTSLEEVANGTVKDGTYYVTTVCEPDDKGEFESYSFSAKVVFENGKLKSIYGFEASDESNKSFYTKAATGNAKQEGVVAQLIRNQSAEGISAVTRATCSSKAVRRLYLMAYAMAAGSDDKDIGEEDDLIVPDEKTKDNSDEKTKENNKDNPENGQEEDSNKNDDSGENDNSTLNDNPDDEKNQVINLSDLTISDGTYTVTVTVVPDEWEDFEEYTLTADVTFTEGRFESIDNMVLSDESNRRYCEEALGASGEIVGINAQLYDKQSDDIDMVSSSTCSSIALKKIFDEAVKLASAVPQETIIYSQENGK